MVEPDEPVFQADWERRVFGIMFATVVRGLSNGGQLRHGIERMDAVAYLTTRYYEHWLTGVATRLVETGVVDAGALGRRAGGVFGLSRPVAAFGVVAPGPGRRFAVGDRVRVREVSTRGHTRCPAYVRGRVGDVVRIDPDASVPDVEAHWPEERRREQVCCVRFASRELWGPADGGDEVDVHVDLWSAYLEPA